MNGVVYQYYYYYLEPINISEYDAIWLYTVNCNHQTKSIIRLYSTVYWISKGEFVCAVLIHLPVRDYLTGFHKRKVERRKAAVAEIRKKIKEEQNRVREEVGAKRRSTLLKTIFDSDSTVLLWLCFRGIRNTWKCWRSDKKRSVSQKAQSRHAFYFHNLKEFPGVPSGGISDWHIR